MKIKTSLAWQVFAITLVLLAFGMLMIYSASVAEALATVGDKFYFAKQQLKWVLIGLAALIFFSRLPLAALKKLAPTLMIGGIMLLILVAIPGIGTKVQGARRWLLLPGFNLQPSELIKLIEIIYLSVWLNSKKVTIAQFLAWLAVVCGLILLQPDMGTTIVVAAIALALYFLGADKIQHIRMINLHHGHIGAVSALLFDRPESFVINF